jgi:hypothetical protein
MCLQRCPNDLSDQYACADVSWEHPYDRLTYYTRHNKMTTPHYVCADACSECPDHSMTYYTRYSQIALPQYVYVDVVFRLYLQVNNSIRHWCITNRFTWKGRFCHSWQKQVNWKQQHTHSHHQNIYSYKDEVILCLKYHDDELLYSLDNKSGAAYIV